MSIQTVFSAISVDGKCHFVSKEGIQIEPDGTVLGIKLLPFSLPPIPPKVSEAAPGLGLSEASLRHVNQVPDLDRSVAAEFAVLFLVLKGRADVGWYLPNYSHKAATVELLSAVMKTNGLKAKYEPENGRLTCRLGSVIFRNLESPESFVGYETGLALVEGINAMPTADADLALWKIMTKNRQRHDGVDGEDFRTHISLVRGGAA